MGDNKPNNDKLDLTSTINDIVDREKKKSAIRYGFHAACLLAWGVAILYDACVDRKPN
jgi:hypothetical protein